MRRIVSVLCLAAVMIFVLSACGAGRIRIEDYEWKMRSVMHVEKDQNRLIVDASGKEDEANPDAAVIDMILIAKNGKITITDNTNNKTYEGTYTVSGKNPKGTDYHITIDGKDGYATVAMTTYADGREEPTLPINLGDHSMYFYAE